MLKAILLLFIFYLCNVLKENIHEMGLFNMNERRTRIPYIIMY